jgi:hypothetical protein
MSHSDATSNAMKRSKRQIALTLFLLLISLQMAVLSYPLRFWKLGAAMAVMSLVALVLRVGWVVTLMIAGVYVGLILDPPIKSGTRESQMWETLSWICAGVTAGFFLGWIADEVNRDHLREATDADTDTDIDTDTD